LRPKICLGMIFPKQKRKVYANRNFIAPDPKNSRLWRGRDAQLTPGFYGKHCLSVASCAAAGVSEHRRASEGPRQGGNGFGSFLETVQKASSSKAAGREKAEAYDKYVEAFEQRERRWRTFSTVSFAETKGPRRRGRNPATNFPSKTRFRT